MDLLREANLLIRPSHPSTQASSEGIIGCQEGRLISLVNSHSKIRSDLLEYQEILERNPSMFPMKRNRKPMSLSLTADTRLIIILKNKDT